MEDSNVRAVIEKIKSRAEVGFKKYGTTTDRIDLKDIEWINHAQEEAMDLMIYLERIKKNLLKEAENAK